MYVLGAMQDSVERLESIKAGTLAALPVGLLEIGLTWGNHILIPGVWTAADGLSSLVAGATAWLSGFLFGVTYRYIIRTDRNSHLKSGAVAAFALVRSLAQAEMLWQRDLKVVFLWGAESFLMFALAQFLLDGAIAQGWIKAFGSEE